MGTYCSSKAALLWPSHGATAAMPRLRYGHGHASALLAPPPTPTPTPNPNPNQVTWEYFGVELPLKFRAGFVGATQDPETKTVSPRVGWYIVREACSGPRAVFRSPPYLPLGKKIKGGAAPAAPPYLKLFIQQEP